MESSHAARACVLVALSLLACEPRSDAPRRTATRPGLAPAAPLACPPEDWRFGDDDVLAGLRQMDAQPDDEEATREIRVLAWNHERDDRPLELQQVGVWVHEESSQGERWLLMTMYRNPGTDGDRPFAVHYSFHAGRPQGFLELDHAPSQPELLVFFEQRAQWSFEPEAGFRRLGAGVCADAWRAAVGFSPPDSFAPTGPDFISDEERMSLARHRGPVTRVRGRVLSADGQPVEGAEVLANSPSIGETCCYLRERAITDASGAYEVPLDPEIEYALEVTGPSGVTIRRLLGATPPPVVDVTLPTRNVTLTIEVRCDGPRPDAGRLDVFRGAERGLEATVFTDGAYFGAEGPPFTARAEIVTTPGPHRIIVTSICGIYDAVLDPAASDGELTIALPDPSLHTLSLFLSDGEGHPADGGFRLVHPEYGAMEGYSETQPTVLRGFPAGEYVVERWGIERTVRVPFRGTRRLLFPMPTY